MAREVRFHYQWAVLHDFLPRICKKEVLDEVAPLISKGTSAMVDEPKLRFYHFDNFPFIPVEFSVAAYRLGHSMVRPVYRLNRTLEQLPIFGTWANAGLNGFRDTPFPAQWGVDWSLFFGDPLHQTSGIGRVQPSYKIDTSLVDPLSRLPEVRGQRRNRQLRAWPGRQAANGAGRRDAQPVAAQPDAGPLDGPAVGPERGAGDGLPGARRRPAVHRQSDH